MKNFRKLIALAIAMVTTFAMGTTAFAAAPAASTDVTSFNANSDFYVDYHTAPAANNDATKNRYSIEINWTDILFDYQVDTITWNPTTHVYDLTGHWVDTAAGFEVINHSNRTVNMVANATGNTNATGWVVTGSRQAYDHTNAASGGAVTLDNITPGMALTDLETTDGPYMLGKFIKDSGSGTTVLVGGNIKQVYSFTIANAAGQGFALTGKTPGEDHVTIGSDATAIYNIALVFSPTADVAPAVSP